MKVSMEKNFKEPNFQQKLKSEVWNFNQRGYYQNYVVKFQEKLHLVPLDPVVAEKILLKGLTSSNLRKQTLRKKSETLDDVIAEGFSEVELERLEEDKPDLEKQPPTPASQTKGKFILKNKASYGATSNDVSGGRKKCHHCDKGFHHPDTCWTKYPEKRPVG
ncbi:hypothetical protein PHYPSEUDO_008216 [Phytophthora pseudosyringae]|uniref:Uncharacterized protein n=1 Tax=Phytophthora pseudosyringae TaxID=221518 RepID=A0A8T1VEM0_9STRA|nr:hypothetical protein PHYPSEUDO_008216 [Phytophthora pseudosyringae]